MTSQYSTEPSGLINSPIHSPSVVYIGQSWEPLLSGKLLLCITKKIISDQRAIYSTLEHEDSQFLKKMTQERCESIISWNDTNHFYLDSKLLSAGDNTKIIFIYHSEALLTANWSIITKVCKPNYLVSWFSVPRRLLPGCHRNFLRIQISKSYKIVWIHP